MSETLSKESSPPVINRIAYKLLQIIAAIVVIPLLLIAAATFFSAAALAEWVNLLKPNEG